MSNQTPELVVRIGSFSYRKGYPVDASDHGGGFVFDCRYITNPGREAAYKTVTGKEKAVKDYLEALDEVEVFFSNIHTLLTPVIARYKERGFEYLSVQFGCTGGQHRSIYFAERLAEVLRKDPEIIVELSHREFPS